MSRDTKTAPPGASAVALRTMSVRRCLRRVNSRCDRRRRGSPWLIRNRSFWPAGRSPRRPGGQRRGLQAALPAGPGRRRRGRVRPGAGPVAPGQVSQRRAGRAGTPQASASAPGASTTARTVPVAARRGPAPGRGDQGPGQRRCTQPPPPAGELGFIPVRRGRTRPGRRTGTGSDPHEKQQHEHARHDHTHQQEPARHPGLPDRPLQRPRPGGRPQPRPPRQRLQGLDRPHPGFLHHQPAATPLSSPHDGHLTGQRVRPPTPTPAGRGQPERRHGDHDRGGLNQPANPPTGRSP
jgi:hypothetical protein